MAEPTPIRPTTAEDDVTEILDALATMPDDVQEPPPPPRPKTLADDAISIAALVDSISTTYRRIKPELAFRIIETSINYKLALTNMGINRRPTAMDVLTVDDDTSQEDADGDSQDA